ncbi:MAG: hypothetical protein ACK5VW_00840 [Holosporales bacterium]
MRRFLALAALGTALCSPSESFATPTVASLQAEIDDAVTNSSPTYKYNSTDSTFIKNIDSTIANQLNNATRGTAVQAATPVAIFYYQDGSNNIRALSPVGGAWRTFRGTTGSFPLTATGNFDLTEITTDGNAAGGSPYILRLALTKGGTAANLTLTAFVDSLRRLPATAGTIAVAGTNLTGLPTGWTGNATMRNGTGTAVAATLDPVECTITLPITLSGQTTATNFSAAFDKLDAWNVTTASTTRNRVLFSGGGAVLELETIPGRYLRTAGVVAGLLGSINGLPTKISQSSKSFKNSLADAMTELKAKFFITPSGVANLNAGSTAWVDAIVAKAAFDNTKFPVGATYDTNKEGVIAFAGGNLTSVTWSIDDLKLIATAVVGTAPAKEFTVDLSGKQVHNDSTNTVITLRSSDGDAIYVKSLDATGIDASAATVADKDRQFVLLLKDYLAATCSVTAIPARTVEFFINQL